MNHRLISSEAIRDVIMEMTLEQKAGQLFLLAFPGKDPEVIQPLISRYGIAGCYLSQDNAETHDEARELTSTLQSMSQAASLSLPLLLAVDQEGAWGVLVPHSTTGPGNLALGACVDIERTREMHEIIGEEMLSVGYNTVLGPCADVNTDPRSPIIGTRSFGEFPAAVSQRVSAAVRGAHGTGIITTLKHFPGHGSTHGDTHREIPFVDKTLAKLMEGDLMPFVSGIKAGAQLIMTSHIRYPSIDPDHPATLSHRILNDILRNTLGFSGVIISDSMNMGAIRRYYDPVESTILALEAGIDIVMLSEEHYDHDKDYLQKQVDSIEAVIAAIRHGRLSERDLDQKLERILALKSLISDIPDISESKLSNQRFMEFERRACAEAITLIQSGKSWPLKKADQMVCVNATPRSSYVNLMNPRGIGPNQSEPAYDRFRDTLSALDRSVLFLNHEDINLTTHEILENADTIVIVTEDYPLPGEDFDVSTQQRLASELASQYSWKTVIFGLRSSYELAAYPADVSYVCTYSSRLASAEEAALLIHERRECIGSAPVTIRPVI